MVPSAGVACVDGLTEVRVAQLPRVGQSTLAALAGLRGVVLVYSMEPDSEVLGRVADVVELRVD